MWDTDQVLSSRSTEGTSRSTSTTEEVSSFLLLKKFQVPQALKKN